MTVGEIEANAKILIIAGSETTATLLSGLFFLLLTNRSAFEKLQKEIRSSFINPAEMVFAAEAELPYLNACISEALRVYPAVPSSIVRFTAPEGNTINGKFVPGNVRLQL